MDYTYIYRDANGSLNTASSMPFVARHNACRAIPTNRLLSRAFPTVADLLIAVNNNNKYAIKFVQNTDIKELL